MFDNLGPIIFYSPLCSDELMARFKTSLDAFVQSIETFDERRRTQLLSELDRHTAIGGHTPARLLKHLHNDRFVFTSFRDPVDRFVSWYFHYVHPDSPNDVRPFRNETSGMTIEEFVRFEPLKHQNDNVFVRFFADVGNDEGVTRSHVEEAKKTLAKLDYILFQDRLDEDLEQLAAHLGWASSNTKKPLKVGRSRRRERGRFEFDPSEIEPALQYDRVLFEYAQQLKRDARPLGDT